MPRPPARLLFPASSPTLARFALVPLLAALASGCGSNEGPGAIELPTERYTLENGLEVVLHVDRSNPVVGVVLTFKVGSSHEVEGRTGFAHLFEHLFFLDSENLGPGGLDRLMTRIGSSTNGSTSRDWTNYFQLVPRDALEKTLWAEADKLGFFINTVTPDVLAKEKQVVKNEKRQGVDNQPYGHLWDVTDRALFPEGHPYRWQVIGSLEDLDAATLEDVHEFHERWYGPGNALLVLAGDLDVEATKAWIEHYFGEIPARDPPERPAPPEVQLDETIRLYHEDNFARLPQLTLTWPTVPEFHSDHSALELLAGILTDGRATPFHQVLVEELELAPGAVAFQRGDKLAGSFTLQVRAYADRPLDEVQAGIDRALARFEEEGVNPQELRRLQAGAERRVYQSMTSVLGKAFRMAHGTLFADAPDQIVRDLERTLAVDDAEVRQVYERYLQGRPHVAASFVPRGSSALALAGSTRATVFEEPIVEGAEEPIEIRDRGEIARTPSRIDRSVEPPFGDPPALTPPQVWEETLPNGMRVLGIEDRGLPLVQFSLRVNGGMLVDDPARPGTANLLAETLTRGTARRTAEELELAIQLLGASVNVSAGAETLVVSGATLARNWGPTLELVEEILLEPRFDSTEFELARRRVETQLQERGANPNAVADDAFRLLLHGDHPLARDPRGTPASLQALTLDDLRAWHARNLHPRLATLHLSGAVAPDAARRSLRALGEGWTREGEAPAFPADPAWELERAGLYFIEVPGAPQSVLRIGYLAMPESHPDFWPAHVMNFRLGGGGFASELVLTLREGLGYTYNIGSSFRGGVRPGPFQIATGVRANVTLESLEVIRDLLEAHGPGFTEEDLALTQGFLVRNLAGAFESPAAKVGLLSTMSAHGFGADYPLRRAEAAQALTVAEIQALAERTLAPEGMIWLVVGDAATQLPRLDRLGLGPVTLLGRDGRPSAASPAEEGARP